MRPFVASDSAAERSELEAFAGDVEYYLRLTPRQLPSRYFYDPLGSALFDGLLYLWVGDALVCYRCNAHYRGFQAAAHHQPFEITTGERYRQERRPQEVDNGQDQ